MDIQSFIQSGLLEAYVMGRCTVEESAEVERMAAAHPEVRTELAAIEQAMEKIAQANAVAPPAGLRDRILQQVAGEPASGGQGFRLLPALGWAIAIALGAILAWQMSTQRATQRRLEEQVAALEKQIIDCNEQAAEKEKLRRVIALVKDNRSRPVQMADNAENPKLTGTVWHNTDRCEVALDLNSLPVPPAGKYYQFWAIIDGKPVSMDMVHYDEAGSWQLMACKGTAQAFAISQEDKPDGNPTPTVVIMAGGT